MDAFIASIVESVRHMEAAGYVSAAGLVVMLYDHILTFRDEVEYVWKAPRSAPNVAFLLVRYVVPAFMIIQTWVSSGLTQISVSDDFCKWWFSWLIAIGMSSVAISNFLVLLHVWALFEYQRVFVRVTLAAYVLNVLATAGGVVYVIIKMLPVVVFEPSVLRTCIFTSKVQMATIWVPGVAFQLFAGLMTCFNAFDRPRVAGVDIHRELRRDGFVYFFFLFVLSLTNLIVAIIAPLSLIFIGVFFIWCTSNVTLSRLIFNCRRLATTPPPPTSEQEQDELHYKRSNPRPPSYDTMGIRPFQRPSGTFDLPMKRMEAHEHVDSFGSR